MVPKGAVDFPALNEKDHVIGIRKQLSNLIKITKLQSRVGIAQMWGRLSTSGKIRVRYLGGQIKHLATGNSHCFGLAAYIFCLRGQLCKIQFDCSSPREELFARILRRDRRIRNVVGRPSQGLNQGPAFAPTSNICPTVFETLWE